MDNVYMETTIKAAIGYLEAFKQSMKVATLKNDGRIDKKEEKLLKKLNRITDRYIDDLENLID